MQIVDLNQVFISNLMMNLRGRTSLNEQYNTEDLLRHMILNSIRSYNSKFRNKFGELVIACDDKQYWRRDYFPYYKHRRNKSREESDIDWVSIFKSFDKIKQELIDNFPYRFIRVDKAEADDTIGVLVDFPGEHLIISSDKDFKQLHYKQNVKQYDVLKKKIFKLEPSEAKNYLYEHILRGDSDDDVPNFLSQDDCFVNSIRQKSITTKNMETWLTMKPEEYMNENMMRGYIRNRTLIDLNYIPENIKASIVDKYESEAGKNRSKLFNYFVTNNLKLLLEDISDF